MNNLILIMLAFILGAAFGYNHVPPVLDRYVVEVRQPDTSSYDIGEMPRVTDQTIWLAIKDDPQFKEENQ